MAFDGSYCWILLLSFMSHTIQNAFFSIACVPFAGKIHLLCFVHVGFWGKEHYVNSMESQRKLGSLPPFGNKEHYHGLDLYRAHSILHSEQALKFNHCLLLFLKAQRSHVRFRSNQMRPIQPSRTDCQMMAWLIGINPRVLCRGRVVVWQNKISVIVSLLVKLVAWKEIPIVLTRVHKQVLFEV